MDEVDSMNVIHDPKIQSHVLSIFVQLFLQRPVHLNPSFLIVSVNVAEAKELLLKNKWLLLEKLISSAVIG